MRILLIFVVLAALLHCNHSQRIDCDQFLSSGDITVDEATINQIEDAGITLKDLVDCLEDDGTLFLVAETINVETTIQVEKAIAIRSTVNTTLLCDSNTIIEVTAASVEIENIVIRRCRIENDEAPIVIRSGASVQLNGLRFVANRNSAGSAAIFVESDASIDIRDSIFRRNEGFEASVLRIGSGSEVTIARSLFIGNQDGSCIQASNIDTLTISDSSFISNVANTSGGAISIETEAGSISTVRLTDGSVFENNRASGDGGAVWISGNVALNVAEETRFAGNTAASRGGAIYMFGVTEAVIGNSFFVENQSNLTGGGAIYGERFGGGTLNMTISNTIFSRNAAMNYLGSGGAMRLKGNGIECTMHDSVSFVLNNAELDGGAVHASNISKLDITDASFVGNEALTGGAGAIYAVSIEHDGATVMRVNVRRTTFLFNRALNTNRGGGTIGSAGFGTELRISECNFGDNDAGLGSGGAIYMFSGPSAEITNSTFDRNRAEWGGSLYAENDARYSISNSFFRGNSASEGGVVHVRGDVDLEVQQTSFTDNAAVRGGGAIKLFNFRTSGDEIAVLTMTKCIHERNKAGINLIEDGLYGTETGGGCLEAIGSGVDLTFFDNTFRANEASQGGVISMRAVRDCIIGKGNKFEKNKAGYGGAVFARVDEAVTPERRPEYVIEKSKFADNSALYLGGAVYIGSNKITIDGLSINARVFLFKIDSVRFQRNRAERAGGAVAMAGSAVKLGGDTVFVANQALSTTGEPGIGRGGAIHVEAGAVLECKYTTYENNAADYGGAASVDDASMENLNVMFINNSVTEFGAGGAVGIQVSRDKDIPVLNSGNRLRNIIFECSNTVFRNNDGSQRGGAISLHHVNPTANLSLPTSCVSTTDGESVDNELTCETRKRYGDRLNRRIVRISQSNFSRNTAIAGAGIFFNDPRMVLISANLQDEVGDPLLEIKQNRTDKLNESGVNFHRNKIKDDGYGRDYATPPNRAQLAANESGPFAENLSVLGFTITEELKIFIQFQDYFNQTINVDSMLTAEISSTSPELNLSGQTTAKMDDKGRIKFTATRIAGKLGKRYELQIAYRSAVENLTFGVPPSSLSVTTRKCGIGERITRLRNGTEEECTNCQQDFFNADPTSDECRGCSEFENGRCYGDHIVPEKNYWHANSFSLKFFRCTSRDACSESQRANKIAEVARNAHSKGQMVSYVGNDTENSIQCKEGYKGALCGSCEEGFGRENNRCLSCRSPGARVVLLMLFILLSFAFLTYFIRSVLMLSKRIEFNRKYTRSSFGVLNRFRETLGRSSIPQESLPPAETSTNGQESNQNENTESNVQQEPSARNLVQPPEQETVVNVDTITRKDMARIAANRIEMERRAVKQQSTPHHDASSTQQKTETNNTQQRGRGRMAELMRGTSNGEDVAELLTLANPVTETLKILVNFLQVTAVALSLSLNWTEQLADVLTLLGTLSSVSSGSGYISLDCFMTSSSTPKSLKRMVITILYPLLVFLFYVLIWGVITLVKKHANQYFRQRVWLTYLAINYFIYISMTRYLLRFFACVDISENDEDDSLVWEEDTNVRCYSRKHAIALGLLVIPLLIVVTLGFPVGTWAILSRNKSLLDDRDFIATYGFLYRAYDKHYWEVAIMTRKGLIAAVIVFSHQLEENLQGLLCLLVLIIALAAHLIAWPFTSEIRRLNYLEGLSLFTTILVFFSGLAMNDKNAGNMRTPLTIISIVLICITVSVILMQLLNASEELIDMKLIETEVMDINNVIEARLSKKCELLALHYCRIVWKTGSNVGSAFKNYLSHQRSRNATAEEFQMGDRTGTRQ